VIPRLSLPKKPVYIRFDPRMDFFDFFRIVEREFETMFLLESLGEESYDSRFSVLGFAPLSLLHSRKSNLYIDGVKYETENPYYALREYLPGDVISRQYAGGLVGYLGYDASNYFESSLSIGEHPDFEPMIFGMYTDGLVHDKFTGETFYFYYDRDRSGLLNNLAKQSPPNETAPVVSEFSQSRSEAEHAAMVDEAIEEIRAGNTFQVQIGLRKNFTIQGETVPVYRRLREINPSPHMLYLKFGEKKLIGSSPELLFRLRQGEMESYPLAGTIHRGKDDPEDRMLARRLLNDPKEIAEHNMLIDLHRNDIGRVARFGTVKVRRQFDIKKFSHVQHISSEVVGIIDRRHDMFTGLASSFPAGTLSGAPKIESMKIIERIEKDPRGPYGGAIGHFGINGDCTFAIPIRTIFINGERGFVRASGGIVYDSVAKNEYREIQNKMGASIAALSAFEAKP
jgi:anthranilate synthase component 1